MNQIEEFKLIESIIENSPVIIFRWIIKENWPVEYVSGNITRLGYTHEDMLSGRVSWTGITHPEDHPRLENEVKNFELQRIDDYKKQIEEELKKIKEEKFALEQEKKQAELELDRTKMNTEKLLQDEKSKTELTLQKEKEKAENITKQVQEKLEQIQKQKNALAEEKKQLKQEKLDAEKKLFDERKRTEDRLRKERLQRAKDQINKDGLGAIVTWDEANIRYMTSYYVTTPLRVLEAQFVFCPKNGEPHLIGGGTPVETERRMPWMEGRVHAPVGLPRPGAATPEDPVLNKVVDQIAGLLAEYGMENDPLGIDGTTLSYLYAEAFKKRGIEVVHGKPTMDLARMIKTIDEIELMRITCANSEKAFAAIVDAIRPGVRECDLVGIGIKALYEEGDDHTEDLVCCSGYNTNPYGWSFTDKPIRPGDLIYIDVDGASYQGYKSCVYRTFCCGKATQEQKDLYEECRAMLYDGMSVIKNGSTDHEVFAKWPQSPEYWGYETWQECSAYVFGHGLGLTLHDAPVISPLRKAYNLPPIPLREGMTIALETYAGHKGGTHGVRLEENVLVTKHGCEVLSRWPIKELMECWIPYN